MSTNNPVPSDIEAIIEAKRTAVAEAKRQKEEAERLETEQLLAKGKAMYEEFVQQSLAGIPIYMRPYYDPSLMEEPDYGRLARGWDNLRYAQLMFSVPGLSKIKFSPGDKTWKCQYAYESQSLWNGDEYIWSEPSIHFVRDGGWSDDLEYILAMARKQLVEYERFVEEYTAGEKERAEEAARDQAKRQAEQEQRKAEGAVADLTRQEAEQNARAEEEVLFDVLRNDAVAMYLVKAYLLIREERSTFEQRIYEADEAMYSIENRWSRRAEELRRQADEAERRADDERRRLQDDLDDAEAKLKKAERGW